MRAWIKPLLSVPYKYGNDTSLSRAYIKLADEEVKKKEVKIS